MQHFYIGVEHFFIALLETQSEPLRAALEHAGLTADYVIDAVRSASGKGIKQRLWAGMPNTPRADIVLGIANDLALEAGHQEMTDRDLLLAILEEGDSLAVRVMARLGIDRAILLESIEMSNTALIDAPTRVSIVFAAGFGDPPVLTEDHRLLLRRMFRDYARMRVERRLMGGYTDAILLVVTPFHADDNKDAAVVVKIDSAERILEEAHRYETVIRNTLPPLTARLEDKPTPLEHSGLAGLKYTFVAGDDGMPSDLRQMVAEGDTEWLAEWLRDTLYPMFGKTWWDQRQPYQFTTEDEYDWLLPPLLTLDLVDEKTLAEPATPLKSLIQNRTPLIAGTLVRLENAVVHRVAREQGKITVIHGRGTEAARLSQRIEIRGLNLAQETYYRGETVERLTGSIWETRSDVMRRAVVALDPPFDVEAQGQIIITGAQDEPLMLNPLAMYSNYLRMRINGTQSRLHGDFHLGNILVGPNRTPFLVDFANARIGHTLFDWVCLQLSLWAELASPRFPDTWAGAVEGLRLFKAIRGNDSAKIRTDAENAHIAQYGAWTRPLDAVMQILRSFRREGEPFDEYAYALFFCALRAVTWETMSLPARRLMFIIAAYIAYQWRLQERTEWDGYTAFQTDPDATDWGNTGE